MDYLEFVYTHAFVRSAKGLLDDGDMREVELELVESPRRGVAEHHTGGVRKLRAGLEGRGKSGGARIIYFFDERRSTIYFLLAWPKNKKESLTDSDRKTLRGLVKRLEE